ncbi:MAG TPA: YbaK/EbsC family protein [Actinomycetota bacterium]|nr:YbaK/EbsC family protein [Actinomycetota bacterium]
MDAPTLAPPHAGLLRWLQDHDVDHEVHEHPVAYTATRAATTEGIDPQTFAKVVGVRTADGRAALIVLDAPDRVDLHKARLALDAIDVGLLDEDELAALTPGCEPGAVPAVGRLFELPMVADYAVRDNAAISFHAGTHRHSVRVDRAAWEEASGVRYADLAVDNDDRAAWASS